MALMEFSIIPLDKGDSFSSYVAGTLKIVHESGLEYRLTPMGTVVEGEWDDLVALLTRCYRAMEMDSNRVSVQARFDARKGVTGALESKIQSVEKKANQQFKK